MQTGYSIELNFEGLEVWKLNIPVDRTQKYLEKWGYLSSYHVYFLSYSH